MNNVEVVLHRGAVSAAEAGGEEEEQPAARQEDALPDISRSPGQHAVWVAQGTEWQVSKVSVTQGKLIRPIKYMKVG